MLPSGPAVIESGRQFAVGIGNLVTAPEGVRRMRLSTKSVNQMFPSAAETRKLGPPPGVDTGNSAMTVPSGAILATRCPSYSVIQRLLSGPAMIAQGRLFAWGSVNSVIK